MEKQQEPQIVNPQSPKIDPSKEPQTEESTRRTRDIEERQAGPSVPERDLDLPLEEKNSDIEPAKPYVPWL